MPRINVYSAVATVSEIDVISRFSDREHLASYAELTPRQGQSGRNDRKGHISKHGPPILPLFVIAAHSVIKYSKKMKAKYLKLVRRLGKNRAIVAIARILLKKMEAFNDDIIPLTERKITAMSARARNPSPVSDISATARLSRKKGITKMSDQPFS